MLHQNGSFRENATGLKARFNGRVLPALLVVGAAAVMQSAGVVNAASPIPQSYGLFDTGAMLGMEAVDPNYTITYEPGTGSTPDPGTPLTSPAMYVTSTTNSAGYPYLPWQPADNSTSAFISPFPTYADGESNLGGIYDVSTTFDLTGVNLSTVELFARFESDDRIEDVVVNGVPVGITLSDPDYKAFSGYYDLSSYLTAGANSISVKLYNFTTGSNTDPVALRAEFSAVPEPSVWAGVSSLLGLSLLGRWLSRRRAVASI